MPRSACSIGGGDDWGDPLDPRSNRGRLELEPEAQGEAPLNRRRGGRQREGRGGEPAGGRSPR